LRSRTATHRGRRAERPANVDLDERSWPCPGCRPGATRPWRTAAPRRSKPQPPPWHKLTLSSNSWVRRWPAPRGSATGSAL